MSWQTAIPGGGQAKSRDVPSKPGLPAGLFTNRHGYTLRRCDCGTAILLVHDRCIVCTVNADQDDDA